MLYAFTGYLWHWRTELTQVPGTGMSVLQYFQKFCVEKYPGVNTRV